MKKIFLPVLFFLGAAACADRSLDRDIVKVFGRHSYQEHAPQKITELLRSGGAAGLKLLDRHAEVVAARKELGELPDTAGVSAGLLAAEAGGGVYAAKVFRGSPAEAAGLRDGDRILEIDGMKAVPAALSERLRGRVFKLKVERRILKGPVVMIADVKREHFSFPAIFGLYMPGSRTAFVKIGMFYQGSGASITSGLEALSRLGAKKVIFDLRDCAGGAPDETAGLLAAFAPKAGPLLEIKSRHKGYSRLFEAPGRGRFAGLKVAVLVNSGTAMTAEVFAAALRDLSGAAVIGGLTKGEVSLTRTFRLGRSRKGLTLTVARLFPPSGADLEENGLEPGLKIVLSPAREAELKAAWAASSETALLTDPVYKKAQEILTK